MKRQFTVKKWIIPALVVLILAVLVYQKWSADPSHVTIRLHDDQIDIQKLNNAVAEFIIVHGYGYRVVHVESTIKEVHGHLTAGEIDLTLELWRGNNLHWYDTALDDETIIDLGVIYSGGRQYWIIPAWYAKEKQIETVFDMASHWRDFKDPEDPSKGLFFNCIFGWNCLDINRVKLCAYGLNRYYNTVAPTSPEALKAIYESAMIRKVPVFGYYWEPNAIMTGQAWYTLKEPPHSETVWKKIMLATANPDAPPITEACAFATDTVHKIAHANLLKKAPDVAQMVQRMTIDKMLFNEILQKKDETPPALTGQRTARKIEPFQNLARFFLTHYPGQWHGWVTLEAQKRIEMALRPMESHRGDAFSIPPQGE